jgi:hypothetical protein
VCPFNVSHSNLLGAIVATVVAVIILIVVGAVEVLVYMLVVVLVVVIVMELILVAVETIEKIILIFLSKSSFKIFLMVFNKN